MIRSRTRSNSLLAWIAGLSLVGTAAHASGSPEPGAEPVAPLLPPGHLSIGSPAQLPGLLLHGASGTVALEELVLGVQSGTKRLIPALLVGLDEEGNTVRQDNAKYCESVFTDLEGIAGFHLELGERTIEVDAMELGANAEGELIVLAFSGRKLALEEGQQVEPIDWEWLADYDGTPSTLPLCEVAMVLQCDMYPECNCVPTEWLGQEYCVCRGTLDYCGPGSIGIGCQTVLCETACFWTSIGCLCEL